VKIVFRWTAHLNEPPGLALIPQAFIQIPDFGAPNRLFFSTGTFHVRRTPIYFYRCDISAPNLNFILNVRHFCAEPQLFFETFDIPAPDHRFFWIGISVGEKNACRKKSEVRRCWNCLSKKSLGFGGQIL